MNRFLHILPDIVRMTKIYRTRFDQYEAIIQPIQKWLQDQAVNLHLNTTVVDVDFLPSLTRSPPKGLCLRETVHRSRSDRPRGLCLRHQRFAACRL